MVKGDVIFCAAGVTDGELLKGIEIVEFFTSEYYHYIQKKIIRNIKKKLNMIHQSVSGKIGY